jgi:hypothetical protein
MLAPMRAVFAHDAVLTIEPMPIWRSGCSGHRGATCARLVRRRDAVCRISVRRLPRCGPSAAGEGRQHLDHVTWSERDLSWVSFAEGNVAYEEGAHAEHPGEPIRTRPGRLGRGEHVGEGGAGHLLLGGAGCCSGRSPVADRDYRGPGLPRAALSRWLGGSRRYR